MDFKTVKTVETKCATIRFSGAVVDESDSSSEDESFMNPNETDVISPVPTQSQQPAEHRPQSEPDVSCDGLENGLDMVTSSSDKKLVKVESSDSGFNTLGTAEVSPLKTCTDNASTETSLPDAQDTQNSQNVSSPDTASSKEDKFKEQIAEMKRHRFNPFNSEDVEIEDPFPQLTRTPSTEQFDDSASVEERFTSGLISAASEPDPQMTFSDDYYSQPDGLVGSSTVAELEAAILDCKELILHTQPKSEQMKDLVAKLIKLRITLSEAQEDFVQDDPEVKVIVGHQFVARTSRSAKHYCEKCNSVIWGLLQERHKCMKCGFNCHGKCMNLITRTCAAVKVKENPTYNMSICPLRGLFWQKYRCAECRSPFTFMSSQTEPRLCDYTGLYYCDICHWNDTVVIPARILHNWDFEPRKVCRATKQFLRLMTRRAVIRVQDINPVLFNFVDELNQIKKLREEVLVMKQYFLRCKAALESKLLLQLSERQHFVENPDLYSQVDLQDTASDVLLPELAKIHSSFAQHIKTDCSTCQGQGTVCELCDDPEILFPFDNIAIVCSECSTVLHRHCYMRRNQKCPQCTRLTHHSSTPEGQSIDDTEVIDGDESNLKVIQGHSSQQVEVM